MNTWLAYSIDTYISEFAKESSTQAENHISFVVSSVIFCLDLNKVGNAAFCSRKGPLKY